jgi:ribosomal protein S18 acetylase RimI-like enzyme
MDERLDPDPVRGIGVDDAAGVIDTLTLAFLDDPVMTWVFRDRSRRRTQLSALWRHMATGVYLPTGGCTALAEPGAETAATALWRPADAPESTYLEEHGEELWADLGEDLARLGALGALMGDHHPDEPHWYLLALGTRPDRQGHGLGGRLLAHTLTEVDRSGGAAYLEATSPRSRALYERHGFEVTATIELPEDGPTLWPMWRPPVGA